ncbi:MAG: MATE family efflux transporter [Gemmiger sp.]|uniref:MATE family efflux transporter n=1 Tax=Gemmiger sp. TaxID=2049027 RepID=UPI002E797B0A|nr:MATE family efflux transporter [Gemmiger sp.]MEE0801754.1 MATE family efflux transporter [Gemmiger sp.]
MHKQNLQLSSHFGYKELFRFTLPAIMMLVFTSIYSVVDGFFVSNFVGKVPFAAINFVMPYLIILGCVGFMFGTGGGALIAKTLGEGDRKRANELFSMIVYAGLLSGVVLAVVSLLLLRPIVTLMGAEGPLFENCIIYGNIILAALPFFMLQYEFQCLFATAGKPTLGLSITVAAGLTNMILDAVFVAFFQWGLVGAAAATAASQAVGGIIPLIYFARKNSSYLQLGRCCFSRSALLKACANGSSELMSNISSSVVSLLFNLQLMQYAGEDGVAAYGVLMYVSMIFQSIFMGYAVGVAPTIGYQYGARNHRELRSLRKKSFHLIGIFSVAMFLTGQLLCRPLAMIFVSYDAALLEMTVHAFSIFSFSFLLSGIGIFGSAFFTALNDGLTSALVSFLRILVFQCSAVLILPMFWKLDGIWMSVVVAEALAAIVTCGFLAMKQKTYQY